MKIIILVILILVIAFFCNRLFFLKPSYRRMFKKKGKEDRVSISYAILFDVDSVVKIVQKKMLKSEEVPLYIEAYNVRKYFENVEDFEQIKQTIISFQNLLHQKIYFNSMYLKDFCDIFIEMWIDYSKYDNYRIRCIKRLKQLYKRREIRFMEMCGLFRMLCDF